MNLKIQFPFYNGLKRIEGYARTCEDIHYININISYEYIFFFFSNPIVVEINNYLSYRYCVYAANVFAPEHMFSYIFTNTFFLNCREIISF